MIYNIFKYVNVHLIIFHKKLLITKKYDLLFALLIKLSKNDLNIKRFYKFDDGDGMKFEVQL